MQPEEVAELWRQFCEHAADSDRSRLDQVTNQIEKLADGKSNLKLSLLDSTIRTQALKSESPVN